MTKILLVGNPNTGKTTLFNTIAKAQEHAGNWHGVTVAVKEKEFTFDGEKFTLCDLPGLYSLDGLTYEEQIASSFFYDNLDSVVICLLDANNLKRSLYLALDVLERSKNVVLAVNMAKEVSSFSDKALEKVLNVPVIGIDARSKKSVKRLLKKVQEMSKNIQKPIKYNKNNNVLSGAKVSDVSDFSISRFEEKSRLRFKEIDEILNKAGYKSQGNYGYHKKLDGILLNKFWAPIIFMLVMGAVFFITFGSVGSFVSGLVASACEWLFGNVLDFLGSFITSEPLLQFLEEGVFGGAITVITFMPQIVLMMMSLNFLEDIGYLSRVAFVFDGLFKKIGLTGRSAFSLIMGFGCTTSAITTTRNLENKKTRQQTTMLLPFMSCSAKLPIYSVICSAFFAKHKALMVFLLYILGIVIMIIYSLILKAFSKEEDKGYFILEMPKYRLPSFKKVVGGAAESAKSFLVRVGGVLLISSIVIFLLNNLSFSLKFVGSGSGESILEEVAGFTSFIFTPLGFGTAGAVVAIISGLIAKEMVVSSLAIVNGVSASLLAESLTLSSSAVHFSTLSAISFLVFVLLYSPCISVVISMKKEVGAKLATKSFIMQFVIAYLVSLSIYQIGTLFAKTWWLAILVLILLAIIFVLVLKLGKNRQISRIEINCVGCTKKCLRK